MLTHPLRFPLLAVLALSPFSTPALRADAAADLITEVEATERWIKTGLTGDAARKLAQAKLNTILEGKDSDEAKRASLRVWRTAGEEQAAKAAQAKHEQAEREAAARREQEAWRTELATTSAWVETAFSGERARQLARKRVADISASDRPLAEKTAALRAWRVEVRVGQPVEIPDLALKLVWVSPGTFTMGGPDSEESELKAVLDKALNEPTKGALRYSESPVWVTLTKGYWMGATEVTQAQWRAVMGGAPSHFKGDTLPVEQVSWNDAMDFCKKLTERERTAGRLPAGYAYTLPTEAQWEYACRAGTTGPYAGDLDSMAWYYKNSADTTHPVGTKQANAWGLYDMHGNVWEWTLDWWGNSCAGGVDPSGPASGARRVSRGGSWYFDAGLCRAAYRSNRAPDYRGDLGFRLALSSVSQAE